MPKRKSNPCAATPISLASLDAALDILACETFTRLDSISTKFEAAAGVKLNEGVVKGRWEEAVKRYWVMKEIDGLCCSGKKEAAAADDAQMEEEEAAESSKAPERRDSSGRVLPEPHPGPVAVHKLCPDEEHEWRKWSPRVGDLVLCQLEKDGIWPGKIIDKKPFFTGRTMPKGNHFFPVRLYSEELGETLTIKSRLIPYGMRSSPPLLASQALQSAYHHADNPSSFDQRALLRELDDAHTRTHPGVGDDLDREALKAQKQAWNKVVNWVMNERRGEKMRTLIEEREKRLREVAKVEFEEATEAAPESEDDCPLKKQKRGLATDAAPPLDRSKSSDASTGIQTPWSNNSPSSSIFGSFANQPPPPGSPRRTGSPALASFIRPSLSTPQRPLSPRRFDRRPRLYSGVGEYSPRGRGGTYTPPRILPSGDETAPNTSPVPSGKFDFVSSLGPNIRSSLSVTSLGRKGSLEAVKEEDDEGWTVVSKKTRSKRAGSAPCAEKGVMERDFEAGREEMMVS